MTRRVGPIMCAVINERPGIQILYVTDGLWLPFLLKGGMGGSYNIVATNFLYGKLDLFSKLLLKYENPIVFFQILKLD